MQFEAYKSSIKVLLAVFPLIIHLRKAKLVDAVFFFITRILFVGLKDLRQGSHILKYTALIFLVCNPC